MTGLKEASEGVGATNKLPVLTGFDEAGVGVGGARMEVEGERGIEDAVIPGVCCRSCEMAAIDMVEANGCE